MIPDQTQLGAAYKNASERVQQYITSVELNHVFEEIRTAHKLHLDESGALSNALNAVFLELVPFEKFPDLLQEALKDSTKRTAVLKDVNEKVFVAFRKKMQEPEVVQSQPESTPEPEMAPKDTIQDIEKSISFNEPAPPVVPVTSSPDKLAEAVSEKPADIEIPEKTERESSRPSQYTGGSDPYREPIE